MPKWKQGYPSQKHRLTDESGITLVELLAAISILSIVILLAGSVHMFGQRQFIQQNQSASQANDMSYAMTVMSTELRKHSSETVTVDDNELHIDNKRVFYVSGTELLQGETVIANSVDNLTVTEVENGLRITLTATSNGGQNKTYQTTIYFRR